VRRSDRHGTLMTLGLSAPAAHAEPNPCADRVDGGTGGQSGPPSWVTSYGTWYSCSDTGDDRMRIRVSWASDGPCVTIPYGSGSSQFTCGDHQGSTLASRYDGWISSWPGVEEGEGALQSGASTSSRATCAHGHVYTDKIESGNPKQRRTDQSV
jgi:hypothetical protein